MNVIRSCIALLLLAGCAPDRGSPLWLAEPGVVYCYRTLAQPDCHRQPQPGADRRLIAAAPQVFFTPASMPAISTPAAPAD